MDSSPSTPPPEVKQLITNWWFWMAIGFTLIGFILNTVKLTSEPEPDWYKWSKEHNIGYGILYFCMTVFIILICITVYRLIRLYQFQNTQNLRKVIGDCIRENFASIPTLHQTCDVSAQMNQLNPILKGVLDATQSIGPKAEERMLAITKGFHDINEAYRDHMMSHWGKGFDDALDRQPFLQSLCARSSKIFSDAWQLPGVTVTIKRAFKEKGTDQAKQVFTFARSCSCEQRDGVGKMNYTIEKNSAFVIASSRAANGRYFFLSNNLKSEGNYRNERAERGEKWENHYISTIVVPIQRIDTQHNTRELLGFFTADSIQPSVFNDTSHLFLMGALADQLFNYFYLTDEQNSLRQKKGQSLAPRKTR